MAESLGIDYGWFEFATDSRLGIAASEQRAYCESLAARLMQKKGSLKYWPSYGLGLQQYLLSDTPDYIIASDVEQCCYQDERTEVVTCTVTHTEGTLDVRVDGETADGPFAFVMSVSDAATQLAMVA
jgi:hypothetical protein